MVGTGVPSVSAAGKSGHQHEAGYEHEAGVGARSGAAEPSRRHLPQLSHPAVEKGSRAARAALLAATSSAGDVA